MKQHSPAAVDRFRFLVHRRPGRYLPRTWRPHPTPRNQFEFNVPSVIQTPGAEFERCRRGAHLYRLDQPGNPRGDPAEEPALFDGQFVQFPNGCQMPVQIYSMLLTTIGTFVFTPLVLCAREATSGHTGGRYVLARRSIYNFTGEHNAFHYLLDDTVVARSVDR